MAKNKLPVNVVSNSTTSNANPIKSENAKYEAREREYKAKEALEVLERAEGHKKDKELMKDVKQLAKSKIKCLGNIK